MSAEQVLDDVMRQAVESQTEAAATRRVPAEQHAGSGDVEPSALDTKVGEAERRFEAASNSHTAALALGLPALVVSFVLLAANQEKLFAMAHSMPVTGFFGRVAILWIIALLVVVPLYYFIFRRRYILARDALEKTRQEYVAVRSATETGRAQYLREELFRLTSKVAVVFYGDQERLRQASKWAETALNILDGTDKTATLSAAQSYLNSLNELVTREEREQADENRWQMWAIAVMFLYVTLLVAAALLTNKHPELLKAAAFGVPLSVILWGAAGSLAAILFRFYKEKEQGQIRFALEFRWLIARPIIGIIMGAVVYLALISGLVLVSTSGGATADPAVSAEGAITSSGVRMEAFWIIAFLAGFSDKFYLGVIDLLVARTVRRREPDSNTVIEEKKRTPDVTPSETAGDRKTLPQPSNA
jgi:hypothetical protein